MKAKRLEIRAIFAAAGLCIGLPMVAHAQTSGGQWRLSDGTSGVKAVQATPQPQVIVVQPQPTYHRSVFPRVPVGAVLIPAILMSDGSVYANFGFGYEPVYRSCYGGGVVVGQPAVVGSNGVVLTPAQPTYTQPVPNQQTASQQMVQGSRSRVVVSSAAQSSCFNRDAAGRVFVIRF